MKMKFRADADELSGVMEYLESELNKIECPDKILMQISLCVEEIFVNIAKYAYSAGDGEVAIGISYKDDELTICFEDSGQPFNPILKETPDINASADDRPIGGLGIHIVKKMMDETSYEYINGMNVFTIKKNFKKEGK